VPHNGFRNSAKGEEEMRRFEKRLVGLLVDRGAKSRKWVGGKQVSGPIVHTPVAVRVKRSSVLVGQQKGGAVVPILETESSPPLSGLSLSRRNEGPEVGSR